MIIYENDAASFIQSVKNNQIAIVVSSKYNEVVGRKASESEIRAWTNSLMRMSMVIESSNVPDDCGILIEYTLNPTSLRIDFVISGHDDCGNKNFIIIELKQWSQSGTSYLDGLFVVKYQNGEGRSEHPCFQAKSYKEFLQDMNEVVYSGDIHLGSCAYLHNYIPKNDDPIYYDEFSEVLKDTPVFVQGDEELLHQFLRKYVGKGKGVEILFEVENGRIRPSKKLVEYIDRMMKGNKEYTLIGQQSLAYAEIIKAATRSDKKIAIVVNGGPGTGKSVVAVNALIRLAREMNVRFATPNEAFRTAIIKSLSPKTKIRDNKAKNLFSGTGVFLNSAPNEFDAIVVDEAHRLRSKGSYRYYGEGQVRDVINAARVSIFFVDDQQQIRPNDEGSRDYIIQIAKEYGCEIAEVRLEAQFRCSGADGYINWLDHTLQIKDTANFDGWTGDFILEFVDDPNELYAKIRELNTNGEKARLLAGFAWKWSDCQNAEIDDVTIPECDFSMPWNSHNHRAEWAIRDEMSNQIGCIHTSQGLEFDHVGVIIGNDLRYSPITGKIYGSYDDYYDTGGKNGLKNNPEKLTQYVKQAYKVLLTRGMKSCRVFVRDKALRDYLKSRLK